MSINKLLEEVARRGSWFGGGSVAALGAAASAALLEKLVHDPRASRRLHQIRTRTIRIIDQDATAFSRVIDATRFPNTRRFRTLLKAATTLQEEVWHAAHEVQRLGRAARRAIKPQLTSDLRCAIALAQAAAQSAEVLITTNLTWLNEPTHARLVRRRLRARG